MTEQHEQHDPIIGEGGLATPLERGAAAMEMTPDQWREGADQLQEELRAWYGVRENVIYADGTPVQSGDKIRYHQAPGGLLPHGDWKYGEVVFRPHDRYEGVNEVLMLGEDGRHYNLYGHVIERVS